jgi:hypothetical protein
VVKLSGEERKRLEALIHAGKSSARILTRARVLLKADVSEAGEGSVRPNGADAEVVVASNHEQPIPIFQQFARGHPPGRDDVREISAVAARDRP